MADRPGEFEFIGRLLKPLATHDAALGLGDDAAVLDVAAGMSLVLTKDVLVEGVHYFPDDPPGDIARKALRVNLSDLAAMGARPVAYMTGLSLNARQDRAWLEGFVAGLAEDQAAFGLSLIGGDTTATPGPMTISVTALGEVPRGHAVERGGAVVGDAILVSGYIGDAALGLAVLKGDIADTDDGYLVSRYRLPSPRLALAPLLRQYAHAAIDVSDGLVADIGHIAARSGVAAVLCADQVPLSPAARRMVERRPALLPRLLAGGDDYEIALALPQADVAAIVRAAGDLHIPLTSIGHIEEGGGGVVVTDGAGRAMPLPETGYRHF